MGFGWQELIIILLIVGLIFGTKKLKNIGSDLGGAVKGFKDGVKEDSKKEEEQKLFQVGFLEILLILVVGLFIVGPTRLPDVVKFVVKVYKKIQKDKLLAGASDEIDKAKAEADSLNNNPKTKQTIGSTQMSIFANSLFEAMNGASTDELSLIHI